MSLVSYFKRILRGKYADSESFVKYLRKQGVAIGEGTTFYSPSTCEIDITRPYMIEIGRNVQVTRDVKLLTHDYGWAVIKGLYGDVLGSCGRVRIGDNVFIGMNTTVLKGVSVGDNVVIGANSLVAHDLPSNCVAAGSPCRVISDIESYAEKYRARQLDEAYAQYKGWRMAFGTSNPCREVFREFFWLFEHRDLAKLPAEYLRVMELVEGSFDRTKSRFLSTQPVFNGYIEFIKYCEARYSTE